MTISQIDNVKTGLLSGVATQKPLSEQIRDLQFDTQSHANFNRALAEALSNQNMQQTAGMLHDPSQADFRAELDTTRGFLARRFQYISDNVAKPLVTSPETNNTFVNGINSAFQQLMRVLQTLVGDNIAKLERVLNLPNPVEA
jgi:hypothetical protein